MSTQMRFKGGDLMAKEKPVLDLVVRETGEITGSLNEGDRIIRKKSAEYLKSTIEILPDATYVKVFLKPLSLLAEISTGPEMLMIFYLLQYLSYDSGILMHSNGKILTRSFIADAMGLSERQVDRTLDKLKEHEVLKKVLGARREATIIMNPWLFMRGKRINKTLYEMFRNSRWAKVYDLKKGGD
jgi:DNA-binding transcriptional ArsR family regulator